MPHSEHTIAVALHDVEPATFERCARIRVWLQERGVAHATLLVIPARDLHPVGERSPELVRWLIERRRLGDAIAQHGFQHEQLRRASASRHLLARARTRRGAEFIGLDDEETRRAVEAGWRLMKLAGIEPEGFVAPAYAYTPALRRVLGARFRWWASLMGLHGALPAGQASAGQAQHWSQLAPTWSLGAGGRLKRALSPAAIRAGALLAGHTLRLDLRPSDLEDTANRDALEWALARAAERRTAVTYDELADAGSEAAHPAPGGMPSQTRRVGAERSERLAL